jgi:hypothetical protein
MKLTLIGGIICLVLALTYRVLSFVTKEKQNENHYALVSEIYTAATIILSCMGSIH